MLKIAYCAGHYLGTLGKRVPKSLDPKQTREWTLNDRVAYHFARAALEYDGVEILRTDDSTGKTHISIKNRTAKANAWGADVYIDMHHNAAGKIFSGGGVVAFSKKKDAAGATLRDAIYEEIIAAGGLKGNRANPKVEKNYNTMVYAKATAVLIEYGFMDSKVDAPVILQESYSKLVAYATMAAIAKVYGLKKKAVMPTTTTKSGVCNVEIKVLKKGAKGDQVKAMQALLNMRLSEKLGNEFVLLEIDGSFGAKTLAAVEKFQDLFDLVVDGSCGGKTWASLLGVS